MEDFRPSITALGVAKRRAAHQLFEDRRSSTIRSRFASSKKPRPWISSSGLDTFAYRNPNPVNERQVFEVDQGKSIGRLLQASN